jgi:DNA (cytosine-5)-methyltransferase 1
LFFEALRVVCELQPRAVVLENVAALLTRGLDRVLGSLAEVGFDAEWHCIPAAAVGAPHYRDRVFVLAFNANGFNVSSLRASAKFQQETAASRSSGGEDSKACTDTNGNRFDKTREGIASTWSDGIVRNDWWATEPAVGRVADGVSNRVDRLRGLGNAVVPQVAEYVGRRVVDMLTA